MSILTSVWVIHVRAVLFVQIAPVVSRVSVLEAVLEIRIAMGVPRIILLTLPAAMITRAHLERHAFRILIWEQMCAFVDKDSFATRATKSVAMWTSVLRMGKNRADETLFAKIYQAAMNVIVRPDSMAIRISLAKNAVAWNVNANRRTNLSVANASWLVAMTAESVPKEPNASPSLGV